MTNVILPRSRFWIAPRARSGGCGAGHQPRCFHWERPFRKPFWLARAPGHEFDSGCILLAAQPIRPGERDPVFITAPTGRRDGGDGYNFASGIGLRHHAAGPFRGICNRWPGATSHLETTAGKRRAGDAQTHYARHQPASSLTPMLSAGEIRVELLDADGKRVRGFSQDDAVPIPGRFVETRRAVEVRRLSGLPEQPYLPSHSISKQQRCMP